MGRMPVELNYPLFALFLVLLVVLFVKKDRFIPLFWPSFIWGFLADVVFVMFFGRWLGLFQWVRTLPFDFYGSPVWVNFAWILAMMLFFNFLPKRNGGYVRPLYFFAFALIDQVFYHIGLLKYIRWSPFWRFATVLVWEILAAWNYTRLNPAEFRGRPERDSGTT